MPGAPLVPARSARPDDLQELTHSVRRELIRRGEYVPSSWVEESASDLKTGRLEGFLLPPGEPAGIAFYSVRPHRAFGHVHVEPGPEAVARVDRLIESVRASVPVQVERLDMGVSGLDPAQESELASRLLRVPGSQLLVRLSLDRAVGADPGEPVPVLPTDVERVSVDRIPTDALAELDWRAFRGTPDEQLVADTVEENRGAIEEILTGRTGRFLPDASAALVEPDGRLVAALVTAEQSAQQAIFLILVVEPDRRRRGLARFLLSWGRRALRALGYDVVRLWVTEVNEPARRLYEQAGFVKSGSAVLYRWSRGGGSATPQPHSAR